MKCPKCGYNSFESHSSCKKCSADLGAYKQSYNITPIVLPPENREEMAEEFRSASLAHEQPVDGVETHDDMFSFDTPENDAEPPPPPPPSSSFAAAAQNDDPFNFADDVSEAAPLQAKAVDEGFADLLESTNHSNDDPFASFTAAPSAPPVPAVPQVQPAAPASASGEFELENFSWDDTPAATATGGEQSATADFDTLFGDTGGGEKK